MKTDDQAVRERRTRRRSLTAAVPVTVAVLVVAAVALLLSPGLRRQLDLSTSRQSDPYVELYFADPGLARTCPAVGNTLSLPVRLRSHLGDDTDLTWTGTVTTGAGTFDTADGRAVTAPGATTALPVAVRVPSGAYDVSVTLADRTEHLLLHCGTSTK